MLGSCWDDVNWASNAGFLQASGGTILGVPRLEVPGGAYRSPQSGTYSLEEAGSKKSTPAGLLQGKEQGDASSEGSETFEIGGDAKAKWKPLPIELLSVISLQVVQQFTCTNSCNSLAVAEN